MYQWQLVTMQSNDFIVLFRLKIHSWLSASCSYWFLLRIVRLGSILWDVDKCKSDGTHSTRGSEGLMSAECFINYYEFEMSPKRKITKSKFLDCFAGKPGGMYFSLLYFEWEISSKSLTVTLSLIDMRICNAQISRHLFYVIAKSAVKNFDYTFWITLNFQLYSHSTRFREVNRTPRMIFIHYTKPDGDFNGFR